jgi:DNA polymerase-3 subunit delta'
MALLCERCGCTVDACRSCRGCRLFQAGTHPDFVLVSPSSGKKQIGVEAVRELVAYLALTGRYAGYKVAMLMPAEAMTRSAANALLKTLEEPTGSSVFLLVSHHSAMLPATIRSRCQRLEFPVPPRDLALAWLKERVAGEANHGLLLDLAGGTPLTALELAESAGRAQRDAVYAQLAGLVTGQADPISVAAEWQRLGLDQVSHWLVLFAGDLMRLSVSPAAPRLANPDLRQAMQRVAEKLDLRRIYDFVDRCIEARRISESAQSVNQQLLLEGIAIDWARPRGQRLAKGTD